MSEEEKKSNKNMLFTKETAGVMTVLISALCFVLLVTKDKVFGKLGTAIDGFLFGAFGKCAFVVTLSLVFFGIMLIIDKKIKIPFSVKFFGTLTVMLLIAFIEVLSLGDAGNFAEYTGKAYDLGTSFSSATIGGVCVAVYAYPFAKLTVAGGAVCLAILTLLCGYVAISKLVKNVNESVPKSNRFRGVFVGKKKKEKNNSAKDTASVSTESVAQGDAQTNTTGDSGQNASDYSAYNFSKTEISQGSGASRLFVNNADDFAFKTRKDNRQKDVPQITISEAENGLKLGRIETESGEKNGLKDYQSKLEYVKQPAKVDLTSTNLGVTRPIQNSSTTQSSDTTQSVDILKARETEKFTRNTNDTEQVLGNENRNQSFPTFEYNGSEIIGDNIDSTERRSMEFGRRYGSIKDDMETKNVPDPDETFRPVDKTTLNNTNTEENNGTTNESLGENKNSSESFASRTCRSIEEVLMGKPDDTKANETGEGTNLENTEKSYESRVEKDGNGSRRRDIFDTLDTNTYGQDNDTPSRSRFASVSEPENVEAKPEEPVKEEPPKKKMPIHVEYNRPPLDLLETYNQTADASEENHDEKLETIKKTLEEFHVNVEPHGYVQGPSITRYELNMPAGISVKSILKYDDDLRMRLASRDGIRIEAPIPGKNLIGIEVANKHRVTVGLKSVIEGSAGKKSKPGDLIFALGKNIVGDAIVDNLAKGHHYLVAGATGSGKSVCLNVMLVSMIMRYSPEELRLVLIDPKQVGFRIYEHLPHLIVDEIITDPQRSLAVLSWAYLEQERRYSLFAEASEPVSDITAYNDYIERTAKDTVPKLPRIVIVVDELADLMETCKKDMDSKIRALAQKARAAGIHLVLATQRPSVDIITGTIKANLPSRIALKVMNFNDSQTILSEAGAEKLLGNGDMLYKNSGMPECERYQGAWISDKEINNIVSYIRDNNEAYFDDEIKEYLDKETKPKQEDVPQDADVSGGIDTDDLFLKALALAITSGSASISQFQRRFQIGYARAGSLIDKMERNHFISGNEGSKARKVLITREEFESKFGPLPETY